MFIRIELMYYGLDWSVFVNGYSAVVRYCRWDNTVTFQKGNNPRTKAMAEAKAKVLALVSEGMPVQRAMEQLGKKPDTVRIWISSGNWGTCIGLWTTCGWEPHPTSPSKLMHSRLLFLDIILCLS